MTASPDQNTQGPQGRPGPRRRLSDRFMLQAPVAAVDQLSRTMRRIRLDVSGLGRLEWKAGQQVRVQVGSSSGAVDWLVGQLRTYSIWDLDADHLDLVVLEHGGNRDGHEDGPGAAWARTAEPGQPVRFLRPQGDFVLRQGAAEHVFIGEETAAVPFGAMMRALTGEQRGTAVIEIEDPADQIPLPTAGTVRWYYRGGRSAASSATLVEAVRAADLPSSGVAYVAGEARTIQMVRKHLVEERGWARRDVVTKPFWTPGKKGME